MKARNVQILTGFNSSSSGSSIIVTIDSGSTVYITDESGQRFDAQEENGTWTFEGFNVGTYTITANLGNLSTTKNIVIQEEGQLLKYKVLMSYFKAYITVVYPAGSICTCAKGDVTFTAENTSGSHVFEVDSVGIWTIKSTNGSESVEQNVTISVDGQSVSISLGYHIYASDFEWASYGTLNTDYQIVDDSDVALPQSVWPTTKNWKARLLTSKSTGLKALKDGEIDVFCVGGGGAGSGAFNGSGTGYSSCSGYAGGGGYTKSSFKVQITKDKTYPIVIGAGGIGGCYNGDGSVGGKTSAFEVTANGGKHGVITGNGPFYGGNGGSGGAAASNSNTVIQGGTDGGNGGGDEGGTGQGTTTREFGKASARLYASGGNSQGSSDATASTGDGGHGGNYRNGAGRNGGSGIVVIRNAR